MNTALSALRPEQLTAAAFAPFGIVVEPFAAPGQPGTLPPEGARVINGGTTWRLDLTHNLDWIMPVESRAWRSTVRRHASSPWYWR